VKSNQVRPWSGHQRREFLHEFESPFTTDYENVLLSIGLVGSPTEWGRFDDCPCQRHLNKR
jgi:hypothetical protein